MTRPAVNSYPISRSDHSSTRVIKIKSIFNRTQRLECEEITLYV